MTKTQPKIDTGRFIAAVPLDAIEPSKTNPRKHFPKEELDELARSIKEKGVIQPIVCRPHPKATKTLLYEIVAGERRYRASIIATMATIPVMSRDLNDKEVLEIQVIENLQREDIHELEEAHGYQRLMKEAKYDAQLLADRVGKSVEYIYARLKLLNLDKDLQKMFIENEITAGHAILLARLPKESQLLAGKQLYQEGWNQVAGGRTRDLISVRDLGYFIQRQIQMDLNKAAFDITDAKLVKAAGACGTCPKRTGAAQQLFPEVQGQDFCLDRKCYTTKLAAHVEHEVQENGAVRISEKWEARGKPGLYYEHDLKEAKKGSCTWLQTGIHIDGALMGKTRLVCVSKSCKVHGGVSRDGHGMQRSLSTPQERFNTAKQNIDQKVNDEVRDRIYKAAIQRLALIDSDMNKVARPQGMKLLLRMIYSRCDHSTRKDLAKEFGFTDSYNAAGILKYSAKMDTSRILALMIRMATRDLASGHQGIYNNGRSSTDKDLHDIAHSYGVNVLTFTSEATKLRKEKLEKARARLMAAIENGKPKPVKKGKPEPVKTGKPVQTSTKKKPASDEDDD